MDQKITIDGGEYTFNGSGFVDYENDRREARNQERVDLRLEEAKTPLEIAHAIIKKIDLMIEAGHTDSGLARLREVFASMESNLNFAVVPVLFAILSFFVGIESLDNFSGNLSELEFVQRLKSMDFEITIGAFQDILKVIGSLDVIVPVVLTVLLATLAIVLKSAIENNPERFKSKDSFLGQEDIALIRRLKLLTEEQIAALSGFIIPPEPKATSA